MLLVVLVGGFTLVGGLGGSFYVSYFTCATIFGLMLFFTFEIFYNPFGNVKVNLAFKTGTIISSDWPYVHRVEYYVIVQFTSQVLFKNMADI